MRVIRLSSQKRNSSSLTVDDFTQGILAKDRVILARAITLIESQAEKHEALGQQVLQNLRPHTGNSIRVGITGVPGAGKSTFIDALGSQLCTQGFRVAVLAVDPSSKLSGGSILGDKTRMDSLTRHPSAFIRPSPAGETLGGIARKTRESLLICEAAGFNVILIETVGTGQSEVAVHSMVDFFLVLALTGAGDEIQGMKKGVLELADAIFINKADGANKRRALQARAEYNRMLHLLQNKTNRWQPEAYAGSALTGENIREVWNVVEQFIAMMKADGTFEKNRREQLLDWVDWMIEDELRRCFFTSEIVTKKLPLIKADVLKGKISAASAVKKMMALYNTYNK